MKRVMRRNDGLTAAYYRISRARDDMHAPEIYEEGIRRYCRYRQLDLTEIFSDIDYSGWRQSRPRPSLNQLLEKLLLSRSSLTRQDRSDGGRGSGGAAVLKSVERHFLSHLTPSEAQTLERILHRITTEVRASES